MGEQTVVIGHLIQVRSGETNGHKWTIWKVTDDQGNDLGSCLDDIANAARPLMGHRAVIVNEYETNTKEGRTFQNLKLRSVEPISESDQTYHPPPGLAETPQGPHPADDPQVTPPPATVDWEGKERRIVRQACLKAAVTWCIACDHVIEDATVCEVAERFERWVYRVNVLYQQPEDLAPEIEFAPGRAA